MARVSFSETYRCCAKINQIEILIKSSNCNDVCFVVVYNFLGGIKKVQRVSDVRAMGYASTPQVPVYGQSAYPQENMYNPQQPQQIPSQQDFSTSYPNPNPNYYDPYGNTPPPTYDSGPPQTYGQSMYNPPAGPNVEPTGIGAPFTMLQQPMVQDMALQYGQKLADQGKQLVETQFEKYVPVTRLKYYFAVDNNYVVKKLILLLFPFTHKVSFFLPMYE